jgi:hypothetical protein
MARIETGILGGFSGRIGNVVSCLRHGKYYLRTIPVKVNHPNTEKQLAQRMRLSLVQQFLKPISKFIHLGFGAYTDGRSAYNAAMSYNLEHALTGSYPSLSIDFAKARVSRGNLPGTPNATMQQTGTNEITVTWENVAGAKGAKDSDLAVVLLFDPITKYVASFTNAGKRTDGQAHFILPENTTNKKLYGYLCFINEAVLAGKLKPENISDSCFCGVVEIGGYG